MGDDISSGSFTREQRQRYREKVRRCLDVFEKMLAEHVFDFDRPLTGLNELECTPDGVWANVYETDWLVRVDPTSGAVTSAVDATGLLPADQRAGTDVLNGIAAIPGTDEFLLTGKFWPTLFRVRFVA